MNQNRKTAVTVVMVENRPYVRRQSRALEEAKYNGTNQIPGQIHSKKQLKNKDTAVLDMNRKV